jgi:hypothetical protein
MLNPGAGESLLQLINSENETFGLQPFIASTPRYNDWMEHAINTTRPPTIVTISKQQYSPRVCDVGAQISTAPPRFSTFTGVVNYSYVVVTLCSRPIFRAWTLYIARRAACCSLSEEKALKVKLQVSIRQTMHL